MRFLNFCKDPTPPDKIERKPPSPRPDDKPTNYQIYKESYALYNNTEQRKEFMKEYNKTYRETHSAQVTCECGVQYKDISKYAHARSARHKRFIEKKSAGMTKPDG